MKFVIVVFSIIFLTVVQGYARITMLKQFNVLYALKRDSKFCGLRSVNKYVDRNPEPTHAGSVICRRHDLAPTFLYRHICGIHKDSKGHSGEINTGVRPKRARLTGERIDAFYVTNTAISNLRSRGALPC